MQPDFQDERAKGAENLPLGRASIAFGYTPNAGAGKPGDYVSFGIDELNRESVQDFADGIVKELVLDFNVQGNIMGLL